MKIILKVFFYLLTIFFGFGAIVELFAVINDSTNPISQACFGFVLAILAALSAKFARKR